MTVTIDWENLGLPVNYAHRYIAHYKNGQWDQEN